MGTVLFALTFDDGYRDNLTNLLPILRVAGAPATIFIATEPVINGGYFWFDRVRRALEGSGARQFSLSWLPDSADWEDKPQTQTDKILAHLKHCRPGAPERMNELLSLVPWSSLEMHPRYEVLTPVEVRQLAEEPLITIGAHTHTHSLLGACTGVEAEAELSTNLTILSGLIGETPRFFAYPYGQEDDFGERDFALLRRLGFAAALTTVEARNTGSEGTLALRHIPFGNGEIERFAWRIDCTRPNYAAG